MRCQCSTFSLFAAMAQSNDVITCQVFGPFRHQSASRSSFKARLRTCRKQSCLNWDESLLGWRPSLLGLEAIALKGSRMSFNPRLPASTGMKCLAVSNSIPRQGKRASSLIRNVSTCGTEQSCRAAPCCAVRYAAPRLSQAIRL